MRVRSAVLLLSTLCAGPAAAQRLWDPEVGVQAGYSRQQFAGINADAITIIAVPGGNYLGALFGAGALFATIPVSDRFAVEPQLTASQINATLTVARLGARMNYAITPQLYAAAGGVLNYIDQGQPAHDQFGLQIGLGYRLHLTGALNGRLEANWITMKDSDVFPAFNTYSLLAGVSTTLARPNRSPSRAAGTGRWSPQLGFSGGYASAHRVGGPSIGGLFLPGSPNDLAGFIGGPFASPPTLFAILPVGNRWAIEPSFDLHRISGVVTAKVTALTAGARFDYAVAGGWYGAAGGQIAYLNPATGSSGSVLGATVAWGYRFHLAGALGGRFETSYTMSAKNDNLNTPPTNTLALLLGATIALR